MEIKFTVQTKINKPVVDVFEAVADEKKLASYFVNKSSGPLRHGQTVTWYWNEFGEKPVEVKEIVPNQRIVLEWCARNVGYATRITMDFEALGKDKTMIKITESGWQTSQKGLDNAFEHHSGWEHMTMCLKAFLEYGIELRK